MCACRPLFALCGAGVEGQAAQLWRRTVVAAAHAMGTHQGDHTHAQAAGRHQARMLFPHPAALQEKVAGSERLIDNCP